MPSAFSFGIGITNELVINMIDEVLERNKNKNSRAEVPRLNALRCPSELNGAPIAGSTLRCDRQRSREVRKDKGIFEGAARGKGKSWKLDVSRRGAKRMTENAEFFLWASKTLLIT
jgi:hypothetical protein